jgi:hypothetical protein
MVTESYTNAIFASAISLYTIKMKAATPISRRKPTLETRGMFARNAHQSQSNILEQNVQVHCFTEKKCLCCKNGASLVNLGLFC